MSAAGIPTDAARTSAVHLQAMLIVAHAEPTKANKRQLRKCLAAAEEADLSEAGKKLATKLKQLINLAKELLSNPSALRLPDLLVEQYAQEGFLAAE